MTTAERFRDDIVAEIHRTGFGAHGLHVRIGDDTAAHRWTADVREDVHSIAKGVCVIAAALAVDEGRLSMDERIVDLLPDAAHGAGVEGITLRHLFTMSSGIDLPWSETELTDWPDLAAEFLRRETPGRRFQYANASTYTAMTALSGVVGDIVDYLEPRLFAPLGIDDVRWERCPNGRIAAGGGLALTTDELSRLGLLIRDRGVWRGERLVGTRWIDAMHEDWVAAGENPGYDRYALAGWAGPGSAWRLHGAYGQLLIFRGDAVVTITASDHFGADAIAAHAVSLLEG
ncbi:serine hydrolase domain-containing protein [Microbacterium sp. ZW T5_45]|uniref:serine hydrolase domain-containing protein n=1 Tax=Microbacterium sp. ZW T5_45 TaxID=3378080 RepID=UPI0038550763